MRHLTRARLAKRLGYEDPVVARLAHPTAAEMKYALMHFQKRHGLQADGRMGPNTLRALNVPVSVRIKTIIANLERWRWMPRHLPPIYVRVNVPDQSVSFVKNGKSVLTSKAVIGRRDNTTPILITKVRAVIVNPYWDIPDDISAKALVPKMLRHKGYLKTRHMVLVNGPPGDPYGIKVNWHVVTGNALPYQIRELPGPKNALGRFMLDMPNKYYVYLHDTPAKRLFKLSNRERSHGCVRVDKIKQLAAMVLAGTVLHPQKVLDKKLATGKTQRLKLMVPMPVYMDYWTAEADKNGAVSFSPDLYRRDRIMVARLEGAKPPPPLPKLPALESADNDGDIGP
jgi:murein L,D-transpeptidase YcbB/YkuD